MAWQPSPGDYLCASMNLPWRAFPLLCVLLLAGCSESPKEPIRVGLGAWPGYEFLYLAKEKGFFEEENIKVRLVEFSSVSDSVKAFERGQVDAFGSTFIELLMAKDRGARVPQAFYVADISEGADVIIARKPATSMRDLRGRRFGLEFGSMNIYMLVRGLHQAGMTLADVVPVPVDQGSIYDSFREGQIDVAVTWPPASYKILDTGEATLVFSSKDIPNEVVDVLISDPAVLSSRREEMAGLTRAFEKAVAYSRENQSDAYTIMANRQGTTTEQFAQSVNDGLRVGRMVEQARFFAPGGLLEKTVAQVDEALRSSGQLQTPPAFKDSYTPAIIELATAPR